MQVSFELNFGGWSTPLQWLYISAKWPAGLVFIDPFSKVRYAVYREKGYLKKQITDTFGEMKIAWSGKMRSFSF